MRTAIVGIGTESRSFSLEVTGRDHFREQRGQELLDSYEPPVFDDYMAITPGGTDRDFKADLTAVMVPTRPLCVR